MSETVSYHGAVFDAGKEFMTIDSEGSMVILKLTLGGKWNTAAVDIVMEAHQARELARHLKAACETALTPQHRQAE